MVKIFEAPVYLQHPPSTKKKSLKKECAQVKLDHLSNFEHENEPKNMKPTPSRSSSAFFGGSQIFQPPFRAKSLKFCLNNLLWIPLWIQNLLRLTSVRTTYKKRFPARTSRRSWMLMLVSPQKKPLLNLPIFICF